MKAMKNISTAKLLRVDLYNLKLADCYLCGKPMKDDGTMYMHNRCWEKAGPDLQDEAELVTHNAVERSLPVIPFRGKS